jgi:hypothetical protein
MDILVRWEVGGAFLQEVVLNVRIIRMETTAERDNLLHVETAEGVLHGFPGIRTITPLKGDEQ